jgi:hypothetical protein
MEAVLGCRGRQRRMTSVDLVERRPTVAEYARLIAAVQWKPRDTEAIARALAGSIFAFCADADGRAIGMGRVGYKAQRPSGPAMYRWLNRPEA